MREPAEPRRRFRLKRWHWIVIALLLPFVAGIVAVKIRRHGFEKEIARELAAIRARGEPVTLEELDAWYPKVPDAENGALAVTKGLTLIKDRSAARSINESGSDPVSEAFASLRKVRVPAEDRDRIRKLLAAHQPGLMMLHYAATNGSFRFPTAVSNRSRFFLADHTPLLIGVRLLLVEAGLHAIDGDFSAAAETWGSAFRLADSIKDEPSLFALHIWWGCHSLLQFQATWLLQKGGLSHEDLFHLDGALTEDDDGVRVRRMLRGEMAFGLGVFKPKATLAAYRTNVFPQPDPSTRWWEPDEIAERARFLTYIATANDAADELHLVRSFSAFCAASAVPPDRRMAAMSNAVWHATSRLGTERYLFSQRLLPIFVNAVARDLRRLAGTRTFRTALALERFRLDSGGALPASLGELVPKHLAAVPADPFTGQPLIYIRNGKGYVVYSVGENALDDRGDAKLDVAFVVEK